MASKATSSCKSKQSKKSRVPSVTCPVCEEPIVDGTAKSPGHDSIECEGACKAWLHRGCAGLSKAAFEAATVSPDPFLCPHCRLVAQSSELSALKSSVDTLSRELSSLKAVVDDLKANVSLSSPPVWVNVPNPTESHSPAQLPTVPFSSLGNHEPVKPINQHASKSPVHPISSDKKYSIVLFGVDECRVGISRRDRFHSDLSSAAEVLSEVDNTIQGQSIKDCFRLGKFSAEARRPRPILVKFIRSADASSILSKRGSLRQPLFVKPDLSRAERVIDSLLMKERWNLIQSGTERKHIKIRNDSIYVSNKLHGKVVDSVFQASYPTQPPLVPADSVPSSVASSAGGGLAAGAHNRDSRSVTPSTSNREHSSSIPDKEPDDRL